MTACQASIHHIVEPVKLFLSAGQKIATRTPTPIASSFDLFSGFKLFVLLFLREESVLGVGDNLVAVLFKVRWRNYHYMYDVYMVT